jgi:hypothetical protein
LAIVHNCTTQPDGRCARDCVTTALDKKRQISPGELPVDWNPADRLLRQFKHLRKSRAINEESGFARDRVSTDHKSRYSSLLTRRWRGESGANPSPKLGLFRAILDGNKLVFAAENHEESQPWLVIVLAGDRL